MKKAKALTAMILAGILAIGSVTASFAGPAGETGARGEWHQDANGWWFQYPNTIYPANMWEFINGSWYHFGPAGYMDTGWYTENGVRYFLDRINGDMYRNRQEVIDGLTWNFDDSGAATRDTNFKKPVEIPPEDQKSDLEKTVDMMCDDILAGIINDGMTERQKLSNIYYWIRGHFSYSGHSATRDWVQEAYQGLRRHHGDCYTYFAVSQALLTRAGFPSIEVIRSTDYDHWWNLTQCDGQWYHFDTTPRSWGGSFCLLTDSQMQAYSRAHGGCFEFDRSLYPPTP